MALKAQGAKTILYVLNILMILFIILIGYFFYEWMHYKNIDPNGADAVTTNGGWVGFTFALIIALVVRVKVVKSQEISKLKTDVRGMQDLAFQAGMIREANQSPANIASNLVIGILIGLCAIFAVILIGLGIAWPK